ncbi:GAF domain-containing protein [Leekyejoonella antrihumi]|uniref:GAF domain-containing protein n=1 Tax=Leekyejoonella antrihumi TaxID=1660198 RepID=A0A563DSE0_9MICO|nr:GAF domain-containing protein [Leekyejoonella antrihumi]TWP33167.1 GAF domain-containing protein [Leekyejoonella antrihumi]
MSARPITRDDRSTKHNARVARPLVADSWVRSAAAGVRVEDQAAPITMAADALRDYREAHPLARVFPLLEDVLGQAVRDSDSILAVSDEHGQLLWVCGDSSALRRSERIGFVEGSSWDERLAGTNAPGTALHLDRPVEVVGAEHYRASVQPWNCMAAPIHDLRTGALLGVLDVTGGTSIVMPQTMAMVRTAARLAEADLDGDPRREGGSAPAGRSVAGATAHLRIDALGRDEALVTTTSARGRGPQLRLSRRHSELLVLLADAPHGQRGDELEARLYQHPAKDSTIRSELKRLRDLLGTDVLASRPYRLHSDIQADWMAIEGMAASGDVRGAARAYRGPVLPRSDAPGVVAIRDRVHHGLRESIASSTSPDVMSTWTRSSWGSDDLDMWHRLEGALPTDSPLHAMVRGQLARIDHALS